MAFEASLINSKFRIARTIQKHPPPKKKNTLQKRQTQRNTEDVLCMCVYCLIPFRKICFPSEIPNVALAINKLLCAVFSSLWIQLSSRGKGRLKMSNKGKWGKQEECFRGLQTANPYLTQSGYPLSCGSDEELGRQESRVLSHFRRNGSVISPPSVLVLSSSEWLWVLRTKNPLSQSSLLQVFLVPQP